MNDTHGSLYLGQALKLHLTHLYVKTPLQWDNVNAGLIPDLQRNGCPYPDNVSRQMLIPGVNGGHDLKDCEIMW